jgi:protease-4
MSNSTLISKSTSILIIGSSLLIILGGITYCVGSLLLQRANDIHQESPPYRTADGGICNIAVISLTGQLWASRASADAQTTTDNSSNISAEEVLKAIERAKDDNSIYGVVLRVDSGGGSLVGGEAIAETLKGLQKPSVALITGDGDSAAYLASTGANRVIASPFSSVGDIGVTSSYLDQSVEDTMAGKKLIVIAAGQYKDVGTPDMPLTAQDQKYLQSLVDDNYKTFVSEVAKNRNIDPATVQKLANGNPLTGSMAMGTGLIDELGGTAVTKKWLAADLGKGFKPVLCN